MGALVAIIAALFLAIGIPMVGKGMAMMKAERVTPTSVVVETHVDELDEDEEWAAFHAEAFEEYSDAFTQLFNSYEVKFSKNGRTMIRQGDSGSFKFAKKG